MASTDMADTTSPAPESMLTTNEADTENPSVNKNSILSDSDDDDNWDGGNSSFLAGLNVSSRLKSILQLRDMEITNDDEDDDDDIGTTLFKTPDVLKTPGALEGLLPKRTIDSVSKEAKVSTPKKKSTKKGKKAEKSAATLRLEKLLGKNLTTASDSEEEEDGQKQKQPKKRQPRKKKQTKPNQKKKTESLINLSGSDKEDVESDKDNDSEDSETASNQKKEKTKSATKNTNKKKGLMFDFLNSDNESSESEAEKPKKPLSKKAMLEMHRERERVNRALEVKLKPRMHKKTFADFLQHVQNSDHQKEESPEKPAIRLDTPKEKEPPSTIVELDSDSDSELEIVGAPPKKRTILLSPERPKPIFMQLSPTRPTGMSHRDLNKQMQERIARQMLERRKKMEEAVRRRGDFATAVQRAEKLLEKEKEAEIINLEVQRHFLGRTNRESRNNNGSIPEDEDPFMDIVLSGEEEEEEEDSGDEEENAEGPNTVIQSSDEEDDNLQPKLNRKKKHTKKHGLFDDEDTPLKPKKPEPAHSIANFFMKQNKMKNAADTESSSKAVDDSEEEQPNRTLSRLTKRTVEQVSSHDGMAESSEEEQKENDEEEGQTSEKGKRSSRESNPVRIQPKSDYVEEEAEEEEDEYFGAGGPDMNDDEDLDEFEEDGMLVDQNEDTDKVDEAMLRAALNKDLAESDRNMVQRLLKDITSGGLRRKRAAVEAGFMLDDYDIYDDEDDEYDLVAIRQAALAKRQKMLEETGDPLALLAKDPKTVAFARAARPGFWTEEPAASQNDKGEDKEQEPHKIDEDHASMGSDDEDTSLSEPLPYQSTTLDDPDEELESQWGADIEVVEYHKHEQKMKTPTPLRPVALQSGSKFEKYKSLITENGTPLGGLNDSGSRVGFSAGNQKQRKESSARFNNSIVEKSSVKSEAQPKAKLLNILSSRKKFS
ncbi:hypothetical protein EC973_008802 [Apophysomyces ossiformis]|uniref:DNA replication checkpoint mediator MRC1 domain-containing protein n=1 Tax=Apophysomyces ossiformis TaxID=679940 RepID=A0A8H7BV40_9FUNG|nr:hypothetical protein EC973_008802 [Apophysomyces ossiformis]